VIPLISGDAAADANATHAAIMHAELPQLLGSTFT